VGDERSHHWRHIKILWDKKVTENVEPMPDFLEKF